MDFGGLFVRISSSLMALGSRLVRLTSPLSGLMSPLSGKFGVATHGCCSRLQGGVSDSKFGSPCTGTCLTLSGT